MSFVTYTPTPVELGDLSEADDQEPLAAATTNVSLEQLADAIAFLNLRIPQSVQTYEETDELAPYNDAFITTSYVQADDITVTVPDVATGDRLDMTLQASAIMSGPDISWLTFWTEYGAESYGGFATRIGQSTQIGMSASQEIATPAFSGDVTITLRGRVSDVGTTLTLTGPLQLAVRHYRTRG